jgi:hypothetical protein
MFHDFAPGIEYRELSTKQGRGKWRFETLRQITHKLHFFHPDVIFSDEYGIQWARIENDILHIRTGYTWNGCSPKLGALGLWLGTPDFHATRRASLIHDVLFQFSATDHHKATFAQCNEVFRRQMLRHDFALTEIYHAAVTKFGKPYFQKKDPTVKSHRII